MEVDSLTRGHVSGLCGLEIELLWIPFAVRMEGPAISSVTRDVRVLETILIFYEVGFVVTIST